MLKLTILAAKLKNLMGLRTSRWKLMGSAKPIEPMLTGPLYTISNIVQNSESALILHNIYENWNVYYPHHSRLCDNVPTQYFRPSYSPVIYIIQCVAEKLAISLSGIRKAAVVFILDELRKSLIHGLKELEICPNLQH